ncbi:TPA: phage tail tape measure protein [Bacillus cereus]|uniref:phage tail tape measure protein n=1 Tax=Bacillus sp. MB353a TaxID=1982041 RepID=UPI000B52D837|nr:phage tail tape measure protein [Bacillus sp. MB353a]MDA1758187.1 phage tail tape measure protein [Bacillus cereus]OWW09777.1 phage tail tape measure protein [Bacillus sp. MB353a]
MELFKMFGSIFLKDDQLQRGLTNAERSGQRTTGILGRGFGQVGQAAVGLGSSVGGAAIALGGLVGVAVGVGTAIAGVVHVGSEYTKQMSKVEALSRSNGLQMAELGANARKLGAETRWSATNVAEAYEFMALAGWDSNQMIAASKPLLDLATAGALDLAKASDIVTDTMTPFGMKASEAGRAADVFALAQATANLNVEQLGETMKYAAPVAATFGLNIEQTAAIAQIFANNGIKASMAGTALRAGLSRLAAPPKEAAKSLSALNVTVKDSEGNLKPMNEIIGQLHDGFGKLTDAQQIAAAKAIFGEEAYAGWIQVIKGGKPTFDDMVNTLETAEGSAKVMAETMANNLSGAVDGVKSQLENLGLVVFSHLEPALVAMTNGTNSAVKSLTDWLDPSGRAVEAAKLMQQTDQQLAQSKAILDMNLKKGKITQEEYNEKLALAKKHAEDMMNADGMLAQKKEELKMKVEEGSMTQEEANKILDQSEVEYQKLQQGIEQTRQRQEAMNKVFEPLRNAIGIIQEVGAAIEQFWIAATGDRNALVEGYDILTKLGFSANAIQFIQETTAAVQYGIETMKALASGDWGAASNFLDKLGFSPEQKANIIIFVQDVHAQISNFIANVQALIATAAPVIMGIIGATIDFIKNVWSTILPYIMPLLLDVLSFVNGIISQISAFWQQNGTQIVQAVQNAFSMIQSIISFVMPVVMSIIQSTWGAIKDIIQGAVNIIMGIIKFFASVLTGDFSGMWEGIKQIFNGAIQLIWGLIQFSFVKQIFGAVKGLASSFGSTISSMWTTVVGYFKTFVKEPIASVVRMAVDIGEAAMKIKDKLINPIKEAWSGIMGWIDKIKNGVANMFSGIHIPVPKISVNGSLNPTKWASEGLPSFDVKWAANGALIKPGNPTLIGVGDAQGYDETVLPLRNQTFSAIADGIMKHMPMQQPVAVGASNDRPIEVSVNVDGKTIARATARYMDSELESLKRRRK